MRSLFRTTAATRAQRLLRILRDHNWHPTSELVRKVSHTFGGAKFHLLRRGYDIRRARHPRKVNEHLYRLEREPDERALMQCRRARRRHSLDSIDHC
ncbi:MAG: hypothetical protein JWO36_5732 [Myxococcales bacterium]|nr:hypothetical protein [Myxococcales bacterium]